MLNLIHASLENFRVPLDSIKPFSKNARLHPPENLIDIKASLSAFGQDQLIVVRKATGEIVKGNGRWLAMKELGWTECAAIFVDEDHLASLARGISDNRTSETSKWDDELLYAELSELGETEWAEATGFSEQEIAALADSLSEEGDAEAQAREPVDDTRAAELAAKWGTTKGQLWQVGDHLLMCGDSCNPQDVANLMRGELFTVCFTDPPYGVSYDATAYPQRSQHAWRKIEGDDLKESDLLGFCQKFLSNLMRFGQEHWVGYVCFASMTQHILRAAIASLRLKTTGIPIIWRKEHFAPSWMHYHTQHELIYYLGPGSSRMEAWFGERNESTVWDVNRDLARDYVHPSQKPAELAERGIKNSSQPGSVVVDLFGGSGSTLVAAHLNHRKGRIMEIDPGYTAVILERMKPLVKDIHQIEVQEFPIPAGPEIWHTRSFFVSETQREVIDRALQLVARDLKGKNTEGRALEMLAANFLSDGNLPDLVSPESLVEAG